MGSLWSSPLQALYARLLHHRLSSQRAQCDPLFAQLPARDEGWGEGGFSGLWSGDCDLHLHLDRALPPCSRLPRQEADKPGFLNLLFFIFIIFIIRVTSRNSPIELIISEKKSMIHQLYLCHRVYFN